LTRELTTDLSMLERLVELLGKNVLDVGCGGGGLARELSGRGAQVNAVETSEEQLAPAIAADGNSGVRYLLGRAQELPLDDSSMDLVVFMRSLHHVPPADLRLALVEARRVLRAGGALYVAEPLPQGDYFALTSLVEDELEVREAAQNALAQAAGIGLERTNTVDYDVRSCLANFAAFRARIVSADPARAETFDARRAELAEAFQRLGVPGAHPRERCFVQPMRADVLRAVPT
jgi:SAM-dependent methyltransferase